VLLDHSAARVAYGAVEIMRNALATKPHRLPFAEFRVKSLRLDPQLNICGGSCELPSEAECQAAGAESEAEAAGLGVASAGVKQLRGDAEGAPEQPCVRAVKAGEPGEGRERVGV
jgi:hypothetical protein